MKLKYVFLKIIKICIKLLIISQLNFCSHNQEKILEIPIDSLSINVLSLPIDICASDEYLYIADIQNKAIYKIYNDNIIEEYHSPGKAPGDIICPQEIQCKNDTIFVMDTQLCRLSAFNQNFKYLFSFQMNSSCHSFIVSKNKKVYISKYFGDSLIVECDFNGNITNKFLNNTYPSYDINNPLNNAINISINERDNELLYAYTLKNYIGIIDINENSLENKIVYDIELPFKKLKMGSGNDRYFIECSGTIQCSDFKEYKNKIIILSGGGFQENMGDFKNKKPIKGMKYYLILYNGQDIQNFIINLPIENGYGYRFAILKNKIYFISLGRQKIYFTEINNIGL